MTDSLDAPGPLRILIVDDHPSFRAGLRALLATDAGVRVVGEASTGAAAISAVASLGPDVVLMDITMPGLDGVEATARIVDAAPHVAVVVLTMHDDDATVLAALRAGARGYLLKGAGRAELLRAVHAAAAGEALLGAVIARRMTGYLGRSGAGAGDLPFPALSGREREILAHVAVGRSNPDIARRLGLAPKTVRNHVSNVFAKLDVADRSAAIALAREAGLDEPPRD
ncbi:MAG TPA: response regulator transcription factor [Candidatus Limnocylindrales bacterium]|nr:response regulator transcription factor [Candidatus Limnocylindrales bacterium]